MAQRAIVQIDEELCDGCGECVVACAESALQIVDGKARLVRDILCDGFGDCIGHCPTGALTIEERQAAPYDAGETRAHVERTAGEEGLQRFEAAARKHTPPTSPSPGATQSSCPTDATAGGAGPSLAMFRPGPSADGGGCPGSRSRAIPGSSGVDDAPAPPVPLGGEGPKQAIPSELRQWPVQLHLVQPGAPFFRDRELVVLSTCGPVASADVHWRFLRGRSVVVACPKLDDTRTYAGKLAAILAEPSIPRVLVVRMEVPCCGGLTTIVTQAAAMSGRPELPVEEVTLGLNGDLQSARAP